MSIYKWADIYEPEGEPHNPENPNENVFTEVVLREDYDVLADKFALVDRLLRASWSEYPWGLSPNLTAEIQAYAGDPSDGEEEDPNENPEA